MSKILKGICDFFYLALAVAEFWAILLFFYGIKVAKHIGEWCCHLVAETERWFPLLSNRMIRLKRGELTKKESARESAVNRALDGNTYPR